jgi:DNA-binding response OmpR family regulator
MKQQSTARQTAEQTRGFHQLSGRHSDFMRVNLDLTIRFGPFCVHPRSRQLFADGQPVDIGSRAFDLLVVLLEARGALVPKEWIMRRLWPATVVEECNLRQQMAFLRKTLGNSRDAIKTIPGRGYVFAADTEAVDTHAWMPAADPNTVARSHRGATYDQTSARQASRDCAQEVPPTVVIVDDDQDVREALRDFLQAAGLRVELFASIQEFLIRTSEAPMGCLVLDIMLPGRNGLDFQGELARVGVAVPVVFISGHADIPMSVRAMKAGAVEFLTKPVSRQDLLNAIFVALGPPETTPVMSARPSLYC